MFGCVAGAAAWCIYMQYCLAVYGIRRHCDIVIVTLAPCDFIVPCECRIAQLCNYITLFTFYSCL